MEFFYVKVAEKLELILQNYQEIKVGATIRGKALCVPMGNLQKELGDIPSCHGVSQTLWALVSPRGIHFLRHHIS